MSNLTGASIVAMALILGGWVVTMVALGGDKWASFEVTDGEGHVMKGHYGLIKNCLCNQNECECVKIDPTDKEIPAYGRACLAAVCIAFLGNLLALGSMVCWVLNVGSESLHNIHKMVVYLALAVAVFWNVIAAVVFAVKDGEHQKAAQAVLKMGGANSDYKLGWAWGMTIVAAILDLGGWTMALISKKE